MTPIELPIFHHSDETSNLNLAGLEYNFGDAEIRPVTFFIINAISPYSESIEDKDRPSLSSIHANGSEYICPIPYKKLLKKIEQARNPLKPY